MKRPTMKDVAKEAGVSPALVSIIFREAPGASEATRKKVLKVAERIGYTRDERARLLRSADSDSIGVCFQTRQPFQQQILDRIYACTNENKYQIVLSACSTTRTEEQALSALLSLRCGVLINLSSTSPVEEIKRLGRNIPVLTVGTDLPDINCVVSDDENGAKQAVNHLIELGHKEIVLGTCPGAAGAEKREKGFLEAAKLGGVKGRIVTAGMTEEDGANALDRLFKEGLPTAFIGFNDRCAFGAICKAWNLGIRVPEDISIVGFDDSEIAKRSFVQMTSVAQDTKLMGKLASDLALSLINKPVSPTNATKREIVPTTLKIRNTTCPPKNSGLCS